MRLSNRDTVPFISLSASPVVQNPTPAPPPYGFIGWVSVDDSEDEVSAEVTVQVTAGHMSSADREAIALDVAQECGVPVRCVRSVGVYGLGKCNTR